jgi:hypothetical protein
MWCLAFNKLKHSSPLEITVDGLKLLSGDWWENGVCKAEQALPQVTPKEARIDATHCSPVNSNFFSTRAHTFVSFARLSDDLLLQGLINL